MADNSSPTPPLTSDQRRGLVALMGSKDIKTAAIDAGVSERSMYRWLKQDAFMTELHAAEAAAITAAVTRLAELAGEAVATLKTIMQDKEAAAGTRVQAANIVLARLMDLREFASFEERLARLEESINEKSKSNE